MANYNFFKDLTIGEKGEVIMKEYLEDKGFYYISDNKNNEYDLLMSLSEKPYKFEIKTDVFCEPHKDTGNIFVEVESYNKDKEMYVKSGINVTKSDYFVNYFPYLKEIWIIKSNKLKTLLKSNNFELKEFSGDNGKVKGYVIPRYRYKEYFIFRRTKYKWID